MGNFNVQHASRFEELINSPLVGVGEGASRSILRDAAARLPFHRPETSVAEPVPRLVGATAVMRDLLHQIELIGESDAPVLIEGETGVGKNLVAQAIHQAGPRRDEPFVAVNVPSLREELFEAELFGRVLGPRSDLEPQDGLAVVANGGTIFFDDVGELTARSQAVLVRFLDEREVWPGGGSSAVRVDVRILSATSRDLLRAVQDGTFRRDLYYRLRGIALRVPSLRERRQDLPLLVDHFLEEYGHRFSKPVSGVDGRALEVLAAHDWRGNVRELENEIQRAVVMMVPGARLTVDVLSPQLRVVHERRRQRRTSALKRRSREQERRMVLEAIERHNWNVSATARELGISRVGLNKKLKVLGIQRPDAAGTSSHAVVWPRELPSTSA